MAVYHAKWRTRPLAQQQPVSTLQQAAGAMQLFTTTSADRCTTCTRHAS